MANQFSQPTPAPSRMAPPQESYISNPVASPGPAPALSTATGPAGATTYAAPAGSWPSPASGAAVTHPAVATAARAVPLQDTPGVNDTARYDGSVASQDAPLVDVSVTPLAGAPNPSELGTQANSQGGGVAGRAGNDFDAAAQPDEED